MCWVRRFHCYGPLAFKIVVIFVSIPVVGEDFHQYSTFPHEKPFLFIQANTEALHVKGLAAVRQET